MSNPEIILLDEATSALDNEMESIIQESLKLFAGKTIITVAHRLTTIQDSDMIYLVGDHTVQESGTHEELMQMDGQYARLYKKNKNL